MVSNCDPLENLLKCSVMKRSAPLNALRAFEVAARTGSFANAARELGVSSAAISQQVKLLENYWGTTLFIRQGNRIALTDAGLTAYPQLGQSMGALEDLSDMMRRTERRKRLVLSAPQSVAETWLAPKLSTLNVLDLGSTLDIRVEDDPIDFVRDKVDMRIFYGHDLYADYRVEPLYSDDLVAVASPAFIAEHGSELGRIEDQHLIQTDWGRDYSTSPNWSSVLTSDRIVDHNAGMRVQASSVALSFARQGLGVALVPQRMAEEDQSSGRISQMQMEPVRMEHDYMIAYPKRLVASATINSVVQSLME
jgi:LysR family glycine cleavage system transcriptional activator